jgi:hypothetical protein
MQDTGTLTARVDGLKIWFTGRLPFYYQKCVVITSTVTVFREGVRHRSILIAFGEAEIAPSPYANDRYATPHYAAKPW